MNKKMKSSRKRMQNRNSWFDSCKNRAMRDKEKEKKKGLKTFMKMVAGMLKRSGGRGE